MSEEPKKSSFQLRLEKFEAAKSAKPSDTQQIAAFAIFSAIAVLIIYLCFVGFTAVPLNWWVVLGLAGVSALFGGLVGWRSLGKAGLAGLGAGLWIFLHVIAAGAALLIEAVAAAIGVAVSGFG